MRIAAATMIITIVAAPTSSALLQVPFNFSRSAIEVQVTTRGKPLRVLLDTGVNPSAIDTDQAETLGLPIDRKAGGEVSGGGDAKQAAAFPSKIDRLAIAGREFHPFEALALDMTAISTGYGRKVDAILGYSFLSDKIVMIDYPQRTLGILDQATDAVGLVRTCRTRWRTSMKTVDSFPVITGFQFGKARAPISIDTGSNGGIALYQAALQLPGVRAALTENSSITYAGARGEANAKSYILKVPVGFGAFTLPAGQVVTVRSDTGSTKARVANIGNELFAAMRFKMLLDYRARTMTFYSECS